MTTLLDYPVDVDVIPDTSDWRVSFMSQSFSSPFNNTTQTSELPGARWSATMSYSNLQKTELRKLSTFFIKLRGMAGRFRLHDMSLEFPQSQTALGTIGTTTVSTATIAATATKIGLAGAFDVTDLTEGDYLECTPTPSGAAYVNSGPELKMITSIDVPNNAVTVEPPFRVVPSSADVVSFDKSSCIMMLTTDDQAGWSTSGSIYLSTFSIQCIEVF